MSSPTPTTATKLAEEGFVATTPPSLPQTTSPRTSKNLPSIVQQRIRGYESLHLHSSVRPQPHVHGPSKRRNLEQEMNKRIERMCAALAKINAGNPRPVRTRLAEKHLEAYADPPCPVQESRTAPLPVSTPDARRPTQPGAADELRSDAGTNVDFFDVSASTVTPAPEPQAVRSSPEKVTDGFLHISRPTSLTSLSGPSADVQERICTRVVPFAGDWEALVAYASSPTLSNAPESEHALSASTPPEPDRDHTPGPRLNQQGADGDDAVTARPCASVAADPPTSDLSLTALPSPRLRLHLSTPLLRPHPRLKLKMRRWRSGWTILPPSSRTPSPKHIWADVAHMLPSAQWYGASHPVLAEGRRPCFALALRRRAHPRHAEVRV